MTEKMKKEMLSILTDLYKMEARDLCTFDVRDYEFRRIAEAHRGECKELAEDWEAYEASENIIVKTKIGKKWAARKKLDFDYDASLFAAYVYWTAMFFDEESCPIRHSHGYEYVLKSGGVRYRGDTMNSWQRTLNRFGKAEPCPVYITEFMNVVYTIGNMIPVPQTPSFGNTRNRLVMDYWDLTLLAIYRHYKLKDKDNSDGWKNLFEHKTIRRWLETFETWDNFVERNFLQDFVNQTEGGSYGQPKELWKGHFAGNAMSTEPQQFEQFFTNASSWILARGNRIAISIKKKLEGKSDPEALESLARQMIGAPV